MDNAPKLLGIDYGRARIGVAESFATLAEPVRIFKNDMQIYSNLLVLCQEKRIEKIIVGVSENEMALESMEFAKDLERIVKIPVELEDETLTSAETHRLLFERDQGKQKHKGKIDHFAATLILQRYLDDNF